MKNFLILITFTILSITFTNAATTSSDVLAKVGDEEITYNRLEAAFQKNMSGEKRHLFSLDKDSLLQFLNLFVDYRLKVMDAVDRGYDKDKAVIDEIEQNKRLLTESYYYDKMVFQPVINKYLDRRQYYIKFAYILFPFTKEAEGMTQEDPKELAQNVLDSINTNKLSFSDAAKKYSNDPRAAQNGGVVDRYLISGTIQKPIEDALFTLGENQIYPTLQKTSYGYFILKLVEKIPRKQILVGHILITNKTDSLTSKEYRKADSLMTLLRKGANFEKLAELNSDDQASAINGGSLGLYYDLATGFTGTKAYLEPHFVDTFLKLKDGEISDTIHTMYGIHIIKRLKTRDPDFNEDKKDIEEFYKRISYDQDKAEFYENYVNKNGFNLNSDSFSKILANVNKTKTNLDSNWSEKIPKDIYNEKLFTFKNKSETVGEFINLLSDKSKTEYRATALDGDGLKSAMYKIVKPQVLDMWSSELEKNFPEFDNLIKEFHDGILLFKVEALEVWDKLQLDTAMAKQYFDTTHTKFMTNKKYDISEIFVLQDSLAQNLYKRALAGEDFGDLASKFTVRQGYREKNGYQGELDAFDNKFSHQLNGVDIKEGMIIPPKVFQSGLSIIKINKIIKPRLKTFEEAIPDLAPIVQQMKQQQLIDAWLSKVKKIHKVEIFEKNIDEIYANHTK